MKKITLYILTSIAALGLLAGCDNGFDELNVSKTDATSLNPAYLMNNAIIRATFPGNTLVYEEAIVQQMVSPNSGVLAGGNYNQSNRDVMPGLWQRYYRDVLKHTVDVIAKTKDVPARANLYNMARIWRAYAIMIVTDTYGDAPFTQAGIGFLEANVTPGYDTQESIYTTILTELEAATAALGAAGATNETSEVLYGGNIAKWKKLGYSLMLRAAMRLTKVNPGLAQQYVTKAVAGGLIQVTNPVDRLLDENAVIRHTELYINDIGNTLNATERANYYLAAPFVNYLKTNNDPRLAAIAVKYPGAKSGADQDRLITEGKADRDPANQLGMPMGYDNGTIVAVAQQQGLSSFYEYSQLDRTRMGNRFAPIFVVTSAQTKLLLAEAVVRGWAQGDAAALYKSAIEDHMKQLAWYGASTTIAQADIDAYTLANPLEAGSELEQINTEYWVASFLNGPEAFANFRRSGYPALTPNPYPGKEISGQFIRRLSYPDSEFSVNNGNIQEAINRQGPDNLDTRVWWDRP